MVSIFIEIRFAGGIVRKGSFCAHTRGGGREPETAKNYQTIENSNDIWQVVAEQLRHEVICMGASKCCSMLIMTCFLSDKTIWRAIGYVLVLIWHIGA